MKIAECEPADLIGLGKVIQNTGHLSAAEFEEAFFDALDDAGKKAALQAEADAIVLKKQIFDETRLNDDKYVVEFGISCGKLLTGSVLIKTLKKKPRW